MDEIWKDIPGFEGKYQASNQGRIKSINNRRHTGGYILSPVKNTYDYYQVFLYDNGKRKLCLVSRLVYSAFNGPIPKDMQVNHINENTLDNRLCNLNLMSRKENCNWGTRNERMTAAITLLKGKPVIQLTQDGEIVNHYPSIAEAEKITGVKSIGKVCSGLRKTAGGYKWKFVS